MNALSTMPDLPEEEGKYSSLTSALLARINSGTIVFSAERRILACTQSAERIAGLRAAEVLGQPWTVLPADFHSIIAETFSTGRPISEREVRLARTDGNEGVLLHLSTLIAREPDETLLSVLLEVQNSSQTRAIAVDLEHMERLANIGFLGAGVAHEIKNALVAVRTFVALLMEKRVDDDLTDVVSRELDRIDAVLRQVLRDATREEFTSAPLHAHALLHDALNLLRNEMQARSVKLSLNLGAAQDRINGDERQLRHALLNILINAIEAMDQPGRLGVTTEIVEHESRRHLQLIVSDTGCGIGPDHLKRIFTPFFTTKNDGTGLGLAITRHIIKQHDGTIAVESQKGVGTTFRVSLPLSD